MDYSDIERELSERKCPTHGESLILKIYTNDVQPSFETGSPCCDSFADEIMQAATDKIALKWRDHAVNTIFKGFL